jgi:restriction endonuclease S subunit
MPFESMNVYFLELMMRRQKKSLEENAPQMAQKNINIQILNHVKIPVPPLTEQADFVTKIEAIETKIAEAQRIIDNAPTQKQAILKQYL